MKIDDRLKKTMIISLAVIFLIFVVVLIIGLIKNRNLSYSKVEDKMKEAAMAYYEDNSSKLPTEEENEVKVDVNTLVEGEYLKPLEKYIKKDKQCDGEIYVTLRNGDYIYTTYLNCENYSTNSLYNEITENETIITDVNAGDDGLYSYGDTLIYRGENVNNYVSFAGQLWRILRIDDEHNIRMIQEESVTKIIWDDRYNINTEDNSGYNNFEKSRLQEVFVAVNEGLYGEIFSTTDKEKMVSKNLCLDRKNENVFNNNGIIECNDQSEDKYPFTLLDISEYFIASVDPNCNSFNNYSCTNYNYLNTYSSYWSMNAYSENNYEAYYISGGAQIQDVNRRQELKLVITLSKHSLYAGGEGTYDSPYIIK